MIWINRNQNVLCSHKFDWKCEKNLHLQSNDGWLDLSDLEPILLDDGHNSALISKPEGEDVGEFRHLSKVSIDQQDTFSHITSGLREVTAINGLDKENGPLYYALSVVNELGQRQVFAHNPQIDDEVCLTCDRYPSGKCLMNSASLSVSGRYFVFDCEGPGVPRTELRSIEAILNSHEKGHPVGISNISISARAAKFSPEVLLEEDLERSEERLKVATRKFEEASQSADESERMRKMLEHRSITDEERMEALESQLKEARMMAEDASLVIHR